MSAEPHISPPGGTISRTAVLVDVDGVVVPHVARTSDRWHWPRHEWREAAIPDEVRVIDGISWTPMVEWAAPVVDGLRRIEGSPGVEMLWCTTWQEQAPLVLSPLIGIGADWDVLPDGPCADPEGPADWWKAGRAWEALRDYDRVVWLDDDIDAWRSIVQMEGRAADSGWLDDQRLLWVCPPTVHGLTKRDLERIEDWLWGGHDV